MAFDAMLRNPLWWWRASGDVELPVDIAGAGIQQNVEGPGGRRGQGVSLSGSRDMSRVVECQDWFSEGIRRDDGSGACDEAAFYLVVDHDALSIMDPAVLARDEQVQGHWMKMGDGLDWLIPVCRLMGGGIGLPKCRAFDDEGKRTWKVLPEYEALCAAGERVFDVQRLGEELDPPMMQDELDDICIQALAVNYRVTEFEVLAMGLMTVEAQTNIRLALVDYPSVEASLKKKEVGD